MLIIIKELDGLEVDIRTNGDIYTLDHKTIRKNGRIDNRKGKKLKPGLDKYGYKRVVLSNNDKRKTYTVHKLVAMAFIPNTYNKPTINHINGIKTDNRVGNLEWATQKEQKTHSIENDLCKKNTEVLKLYNKIKAKKIKYNDVIYPSLNEASRRLGIHRETIKRRGGMLV